MSTFHSFEDMQVWQESRKLIKRIRAICKKKNVCRDFAFVDQITRAARSIAANIAEGADALTVSEFITFLGYSKRSAAEVRSHLYDAVDEGHISLEEFKELTMQLQHIGKMTGKLIQYLHGLDPKRKRIPPNPNM